MLGQITPGRSNPCSFIDNGTTVWLVDGSQNGWTFNLADNSGWAVINDPTGAFTGANRLDFLDTFALWNIPGTREFGSTLSNQIQPFDPTYFASKAVQVLVITVAPAAAGLHRARNRGDLLCCQQ